MIKKINKIKAGFSIIETMIAVSLFLVVVMAGMGGLLNANLVHQKSQDMRSIMDSLSFMIEDMSRNIRTGYNYYCITGADDLSNLIITKSGENCWGIAFEATGGSASNPNDQWVYYIDNTGKIFKTTLKESLGASYVASDFTQLNPEEVVVSGLVNGIQMSGFSVLGAETPTRDVDGNITGDMQQPFVVIKLVGTITSKGVVSPFSLQTSASQRLIDVPSS